METNTAQTNENKLYKRNSKENPSLSTAKHHLIQGRFKIEPFSVEKWFPLAAMLFYQSSAKVIAGYAH